MSSGNSKNNQNVDQPVTSSPGDLNDGADNKLQIDEENLGKNQQNYDREMQRMNAEISNS